VLDSSSKFPPDGILEGSFLLQMGNYDECLAVNGPENRFRGKYCRVQLGFKSNNQTDPKTELLLTQMRIAYEAIKLKNDLPGASNFLTSDAKVDKIKTTTIYIF